MNRETYLRLARVARLGHLGTLAFSCARHYGYFLREVYDLRFPHVGNDRHGASRRTWDALARKAYFPRYYVRYARSYRRATFGPVAQLP